MVRTINSRLIYLVQRMITIQVYCPTSHSAEQSQPRSGLRDTGLYLVSKDSPFDIRTANAEGKVPGHHGHQFCASGMR